MFGLRGETIGLDFYFSDRSSADALRDVAISCLSTGAAFSGEIVASRFANARAVSFSNIFADEIRTEKIKITELQPVMEDKDIRIVKIGMHNAIGLLDGRPELLSLKSISEYARQFDSHPVGIISEGWEFNAPGYEGIARDKGRKCYATFLHHCHLLSPDYAAILNEDSLRSVHDLKPEESLDQFRDFFVNSMRYGTALTEKICTLYSDAYIEPLNNGVYISTCDFLNPTRTSIGVEESRTRSRVVADLLTSWNSSAK